MMQTLRASQQPLDKAHDVALLDLDGVVYVGAEAVPGAVGAINASKQTGMRFAYVTNNASRTAEEVAEHLRDLGLTVDAHDVVTSAQAGARLMREAIGPGRRVLAVGGPGVTESLRRVGLDPVGIDPGGDVPAVAGVLQGFGREVGWRHLAQASLAVRRGAYWVATNGDRTFPIPGGLAPGNGMMVAAVAEAAGRPPDAIAGKPYPALTEESILRMGAQRPLVVGDRLDTDIEGAHRLGVASLLVLTGVTDIATLVAAPPGLRPTFLGLDLGALHEGHPCPRPDHDGSRQVLGGAGAWIDPRPMAGDARQGRLGRTAGPGQLRIDGESDSWLDALRCACAASWSWTGPLDISMATARLAESRPG